MITRGSKFFFGAAAVGYLSALLYGFITGASDRRWGHRRVRQEGPIVDSFLGPITLGLEGLGG